MMGETPGPVTIAVANPLQHVREIKDLFLANERPEFPEYFDRAYPPAVATGATSWLGRDSEGRLVMHIACLPRRFRFGGREVVAGLLANLMVTKTYRSFFPAVALVNRLVRDSKARAILDFLYADPNDDSQALLRGTRFVPVGTLRRYVLPVGDRRPALDAAVRVLQRLVRLTTRGRPARVVAHSARRFRGNAFWVPHDQARRLVPCHDHALYASHLKGYPGERDWWMTAQRASIPNGPEAALLVRGPDPSGRAALHAVRRAPGIAVSAMVPGLIKELRRRGCVRLQAATVAESALGRALRRCGFVPRPEAVPLVALALTPLGEECVQAVEDWEITELDCDR